MLSPVAPLLSPLPPQTLTSKVVATTSSSYLLCSMSPEERSSPTPPFALTSIRYRSSQSAIPPFDPPSELLICPFGGCRQGHSLTFSLSLLLYLLICHPSLRPSSSPFLCVMQGVSRLVCAATVVLAHVPVLGMRVHRGHVPRLHRNQDCHSPCSNVLSVPPW
jgi:hypothetical protein